MREKKLTPWFPASVKPVRKGVYETLFASDRAGYSYWTGASWSTSSGSIDGAASYLYVNPGTQEKRWRGLAKEPK